MELVVMVGVSGSGKTTYAKENYPNYILVSLDDVPNKDRPTWLSHIDNNLKQNRSVIADDENISKPKRAKLIQLARKYKARVIVVYLKKSLITILGQNNKRSGLSRVSEDHIVPLHRALKPNFEEEDFDEVIIIED